MSNRKGYRDGTETKSLWRRNSIFFRTFIMVTALCGGLIALPTAVLIPSSKEGWQKGLGMHSRHFVASIAEVCADALIAGDYDYVIKHNSQIIKSSPSIEYIVVAKTGGPALVHSGQTWEKKEHLDPRWNPGGSTAQGGRIVINEMVKRDVFHYIFPLQFTGTDWGTLYLGLSLTEYHEQMDMILPAAIIFSLPVFALSMFLAFLIARRTASPVLVLRNTADRILRGDYSARADIRSGDEIQDLANSFNKMTDSLVESQQSMSSAKDRTENILASLAECLIVFRADNDIEMVNKATLDLTGYRREELLGKPIEVLFASYDGFLDSLDQETTAHIGKVSNRECLFLTKGGRTVPVLFSYAPIKVYNGELQGMVGIALDMTEIKRAEGLLENSRREAVAANKAKSEFLANMSHEIRTPMNGVLGMLDLLMHSELREEQRHYVETAFGSARNLLAILNDILDLSKIEAGKLELEEVDFSIREALEEVALLHSVRTRTKHLGLGFSMDNSVRTLVRGDPGRLKQILNNLVVNAIKFTEKGAIAISVTPLSEEPNEVVLRFEVCDTGIGISEEAQQRIFDSFTQADASTTRRHGGTGLGLSISRELVILMGGSIGVNSVFGEGSTFWFTAPFKTGESLPQLTKSPGKESPNPTYVEVPTTASMPPQTAEAGRYFENCPRILLAEDNVVNQKVVIAMLAHLPFSIDTVATGLEALKALAGTPYDLVLMDCQMPELDGYETAAIMRDQEEISGMRRMPIIAITANAMRGDKEKCLSSGMDDYITKPFQRDILVSVVTRWLGPVTIREKEAIAVEEDGPSQNGVATPAASSSPITFFSDAGQVLHSSGGNRNYTDARTPAIDTSVLEAIGAMQREGSPDLVGKLVALYLSTAAAIMEDLRTAVLEGNTQQIFQLSHKFKSSSANVGALHLSSLLKDLEALGRGNELRGTRELLVQIEAEYGAVRDTLGGPRPERTI